GSGETEEECQAEFRPIVQLEEVERVSGEEGEKTLADFKSKLYRFDNDSGEWKERGIGQVRLLESNDTGKIRLLMRQEKTLKIRANHFVMPGTKLQEHSGSEKAWVYSTVDFADEEQRPELFCFRFSSIESAPLLTF
ncbi:RAN binding protein, RANBP1, partial [Coccomyxa subellipsoidea C-169]